MKLDIALVLTFLVAVGLMLLAIYSLPERTEPVRYITNHLQQAGGTYPPCKEP